MSLLTLGAGQWTSAATWTNTVPGDEDYFNAANWSGGVPNAAGAVADFSTFDFSGDYNVHVDGATPNITLGSLAFGDTDNPNSPSSWYMYSNNDGTTNPIPVLTLDNGGSTPTITVNPLGVTSGNFDDAFIYNMNLTGSAGFNKQGDGILSIHGSAAGLTGNVAVNEGTLRFVGALWTRNTDTKTFTAANGTTIELARDATDTDWLNIHDLTTAPNATVTITTGYTSELQHIRGSGSGTLNLNLASGRQNYAYGDWVTGGGWDVVNIGNTGGSAATFRIRPVGGSSQPGFNTAAFAGTVVNLTGVIVNFQNSNSGGNTFPIGTLNGDAASSIFGGNAGNVRYVIGGDGQNGDFAGTVGGGSISIEKVGTETQIFSGNFTGFGGHAIRISGGTLALAGTATSIEGSASALSPTSINVMPGATLDVSGTSTTFTSVANEKFIGTGTIVGPFNHAAGDINPGDVDPQANPSTQSTPTAGTINVTGSLAFSGGNITYDMDTTPAGTNDLISVTGTTSVAGGGVITPNFLNGAPAAGLTYTVLTSSGGFSDSPAGWAVNWFGRGASPTVVVAGNNLQFTTTAVGASGSVVWTGANSGTWDVQSATENNWLLSGSPDDFFQGDDVTFPEAGVTNFMVNITQNVQPSAVVVNSTTDYTFTSAGGTIASTGTFTKRGTSKVTMQFANTFTGATIEKGSVDIGGAAGALGPGTLTLGDGTGSGGGTLITTGPLGSSDVVVNGGTNEIQIGGATGAGAQLYLPTISSTTPGSLTVSTNVNNRWIGLTQTGGYSGSLNIVGPSTGAGETTTVRVNAFDTDLSGAAVTLTNGVRLTNQSGSGFNNVIELGALEGDATAVLRAFVGGGSAPGTTWAIGQLNADTTFAGVVEDGDNAVPGFVTKVGAGTLTLTGANTYTGDTRVDGGTLSLSQAYLADLADVFIASSSILDLTHGTTDIIDSLYLGNTPQVPGTYGAAGSGATFESAFFSGTGILQVTTLGAPITTPGDFDNDGDVDGRDFLLWQRNPAVGNLADWQTNYGTPAPLAAALSAGNVPEPAGATLLFACGLAALAVRKRS